MVRLVVIIVVVLGVVLLGGYAASPSLLAALSKKFAADLGATIGIIRFQRPELTGITVDEIELSSPDIGASGSGIRIRYTLYPFDLMDIDSVAIEQLHVRVPTGEGSGSTGLQSPWSLVPLASISIRQLTVEVPAEQLTATGAIDFDRTAIEANLNVKVGSPVVEADLALRLLPSGEATLTIQGADILPTAELQAVLVNERELSVAGTFSVAGRSLQFLADTAGLTTVDGLVTGKIEGLLPWPLPDSLSPAQVAGQVELTVAVDAGLEGTLATINTDLQLRLDSGQLDVTSDRIHVLVQSLGIDGTAYRFAGNSIVDAGLHLTQAVSNWQFDPDKLNGDASLDVDLAALDMIGTADTVRLDKPRLKGRIELAMGPAQISAKLQNLAVSASKGGTVGDAYRLTLERFLLNGNASLPRSQQGNLAELAAGDFRLDAATTLRSGAAGAPQSLVSLSGIVSGQVTGSDIALTVPRGYQVALSAGDQQAIIRTETALTLAANLKNGDVTGGPLTLAIELPALEIGPDQRVSFAAAQLQLGRFTRRGGALAAEGRFSATPSAKSMPVDFHVSMEEATQAGQFDLAIDHEVLWAFFGKELIGWQGSYDLTGGHVTVNMQGTFDLSTAQLAAVGSFELYEGVAHVGDIAASGISMNLPIRWQEDTLYFDQGPAGVKLIDIGIPITNMTFELNSDLDVANLTDLTAEVLGGSFSIETVTYDLTTEAAQFDVAIVGLPVASVLALEGEAMTGDGLLDGRLPVSVKGENVRVDKGLLSARPPGGYLSYRSAIPQANPALDFAIRALRDFRYRVMDIELNYDPEGQLALLAKLQGSNPDIEKGRPIHFNLTINEDIPALLESLRASEGITDRVQDRLSRKK